MARDLVDIALVSINSVSQGSKELTSVKKVQVKINDPSKPVPTMNREHVAIGYTRGVKTITLSLTIANELAQEVDWKYLHRTKEEFGIGLEENPDGRKTNYGTCRVSDAQKAFGEDGESDFTVEVLALTEREEPFAPGT